MGNTIFYYPNRTSPTYTATIIGLEEYPNDLDFPKLQLLGETVGGDSVVIDLRSGYDYYVNIHTQNVTNAHATNLMLFIQFYCNYSSNTFDFTNSLGVQYNTCRFMFSNVNRIRNTYSYTRVNDILRIKVEG